MNAIIDVMGSFLIGSILLLMMITFQHQMQETAARTMFSVNMMQHIDDAATFLNQVIALAGIGVNPRDAVTVALPNRMAFRSFWDYNSGTVSAVENIIEIRLSPVVTPVGTALTIFQNGVLLHENGHIMWVEHLHFTYFNRLDQVTTTARDVRSAEIRLTFKRDPPRLGMAPVRALLQIRCYLMNTYMRGA